MNFLKNRFLFILIISIATLVVLVVGALTLYKDTSLTFSSDGYIIETSTKTNTKYYFKANTKYKENVEDKITFEDEKKNKVVVDPASFVHYDNGNVAFLKKGALVNLTDITAPMVSYYNITNENIIVYEQQHYTVTSNDKKINIDSFVGRINDSKYLIAGKDLTLKIPTESNKISGEYFEINYIEEGIVKIDNKERSYQVTAQDSYIYVGDDITINLGDGKIFHENDAKMLLSQITINGNENINLDVEDDKNGGSGGGAGSGGAGEGEGAGGDGTGSGEGEGEGTGDGSGEGDGEGEGTGDGAGGGNGLNGTGIGNATESLKVELIEAKVTSTTMDLKMQLNNAALARGNVVAYLTNVETGNKEAPKRIELTNGTFNLPYTSLQPDTNYALTIVETGVETETQYFQKTFKTKELGLTLEKVYATSDTLSYNIIFDENSEVTRAHITIYDNNGTNENISPNEFTISKEDLNNSATFTGLKSNTSYSINIDTIWIGNTAYSNLYTINRIDTTLKETPKISGINVDADAEEVKFTIKLNNVTDKDKSIVSYTYNIYLANDITLENTNPEVQYSITKNDSDPLVLNLNEIDALKTGVDYRCKIIAQYDDNYMIREVSTDYSSNFLIRSKPKISWELKSATMNKVEGTITLLDANCTVPINGRSCSNKKNNFTLRYYESSEEETTDNDRLVEFNYRTLTSELSLTDLKSNTTYAVKVFGDYYDDDNVLHQNVQIGEAFYIKTDKSENIYFEVIGDNISGQNKDGTLNLDNVITFDARLSAPQDSNISEEISTITFNLYSGRYTTNKDKLIGSYTITDRTAIQDLFNNITIKNSLFQDTTKFNVGYINTIDKLIKVTNNTGGTLNSAYTVEVADVYDSTGKNQIVVENPEYTFNLSPSFYLDARIETNPNENYITVTPILKENLTEEETEELSKTVKNLEELNDDTVVGLTIENSLSDIFVDSAYKYEKAIVNYTICNNTVQKCDDVLAKLTDNDPDNDESAKKTIKIISVDMGNKYQPKTQTIYLDSSEYTDAKKYFIRGYNYKVGYYISFIQEEGATPTYNHDKLHKIVPIEKQTPIYTQYISTSDATSITYRYNFKDIDKAIADKNFYYTLGEDTTNYNKVDNSLIADSKNNDVIIPINENTNYSLYYARKNTSNEIEYVEIASSIFESVYNYNNELGYTILNNKDNILKIKLEPTDATNRAFVYKVNIKSIDQTSLKAYTRYFLDSKLSIISEETGNYNTDGTPITNDYKYIAIDYANISKFMGHNLKVEVTSYYDSGLIGFNQPFDNGLILKNLKTNKFINIYNSGSNTTTTTNEENINMGLYLLKQNYEKDSETIVIYNKLMDTKTYNPLLGATYYDTKDLAENIGMSFNTNPTNAGMLLTTEKSTYSGYDAKVLKEAKLSTNNNSYKFETIVPTIKVTSNNKNTINSIKINITPSGIYGTKQFIKDDKQHNKAYIEVYSDKECTSLLSTKETNINITGSDENGYKATIDEIEINNLKPATTYYFKVYAYVNNEKIRLYDTSSTTEYITKVYEAATLTAKGIIKSIKFAVEPTKYNGESSEKTVTWRLNLNSTENYKLRFELFKPNGTTTEIDEETGEEKEVTTFEKVKFDGTDANTCDINASGDTATGYVKNCYILVDKADINAINKQEQKYKFTNDTFVFGGNYYKLLVYAIPYTNNKYIEEDKVLLYQNDSLSTTPIETINGVEHNISIPTLEEASFSLSNSLTAGYVSVKDGYYVSFVPTVTDRHKVIKYGSYTVRLKDEKGNIIEQRTNVTAGINGGTVNEEIKFTGLTSNTLYYVELLYNTYRNNVGYTEIQKTTTTPFTDFVYTPISHDITLGTITAGSATTKNVTLTYNGSSNLSEKIVRVDYTISLKGGSNKTTGTYKIDSNTPNIFTITSDKTPKLTIDTSNSIHSTNTSFAFHTNNTYIITTQYYYLNDNNKEELLMDQVTNNTTYTTILNL